MDVVLTEKPSVAREIAAFVGARTRHDGYLEGSGYQITWAYGHLVELKEPHDYDPALKRWSLESLPFVPARFELKLIKDTRSRQQFNVIKRLFQSAQRIICATDAGREGELIFRYILAMTGGGPYTETGGATEVIGLRLFYITFGHLKFGEGAAMAWIVGAMLIGFTVWQLKRLSQVEFRTAEKTTV